MNAFLDALQISGSDVTDLKFVLISRCKQAAALLALFTGFAVSAQAQTVQQKPAAAYVLGGNVDAIVTQSDGKVIVGGVFIAINGVPRSD